MLTVTVADMSGAMLAKAYLTRINLTNVNRSYSQFIRRECIQPESSCSYFHGCDLIECRSHEKLYSYQECRLQRGYALPIQALPTLYLNLVDLRTAKLDKAKSIPYVDRIQICVFGIMPKA